MVALTSYSFVSKFDNGAALAVMFLLVMNWNSGEVTKQTFLLSPPFLWISLFIICHHTNDNSTELNRNISTHFSFLTIDYSKYKFYTDMLQIYTCFFTLLVLIFPNLLELISFLFFILNFCWTFPSKICFKNLFSHSSTISLAHTI